MRFETAVLAEAIEALQTIVLVHRFMLPYALSGKSPQNRDIEDEVARLRELNNSEIDLQAFATLCQQVRVEAAALLHRPGSA
jgi:hypothetical protein